MDATELRRLQAPLKQGYRDAAETARVPARAEAILNPEAIAVHIAGARKTMAGLHSAAGGDGSMACSADMLLEALVACAGVTLCAVAVSMGVVLRGGLVIAEGIWDARGTLGVDKTVPVGLTEISLIFELDTDADEAAQERLLTMTERFCVIFQTLRSPPQLSVRRQDAPAESGS